MHMVVFQGGPTATTSSGKVWRPIATMRSSQRLTAALPRKTPDQELSPGNVSVTSGASSANVNEMSPFRLRAIARETSFLASQDRIIVDLHMSAADAAKSLD